VFYDVADTGMRKNWVLVAILLGLCLAPGESGLLAYGLCQSACAAAVVACYSSAGLVFGTVTAGVGAPAAAIACNTAFGKCSAVCAAVFLAPTP